MLFLSVAFHLLFGELFLISLNITKYSPHILKNIFLNHFFSDIVCRTHFGIFTIGRAEEIGLFPLVIVCYAVIQLFSTIGTVEKSRKHTDNSAFGRSAAVLSEFLHKLKGFTVDNGRVRIREDLPFLWVFGIFHIPERRIGGKRFA